MLRCDVIRKRLAGANLFEKLAPEDYSKAMMERIFCRMIDDARIALIDAAGAIEILEKTIISEIADA